MGLTNTSSTEWAEVYNWWHYWWTHCIRWNISIHLQSSRLLAPQTTECAEKITVDQACHQIYPLIVSGSCLGRRHILTNVAVFHILAYNKPVTLTMNRLVRRIFVRSFYESEIVQGFREQLWMRSLIVSNISKMYIGPDAIYSLHSHSRPPHQFS